MSEFAFKPAEQFQERAGCFVSLTGSTNSGKTFSALRLARGIAGPDGKIAVVDTEGGRTLHLRDHFKFDAMLMDAPFRPDRFSEAARAAEAAGYDCLLIDSFSMEWAGLGGVLDWQAEEHARMGNKDSTKMLSWVKPKVAHKTMVSSFLQRRIPIIFSIRGEESIKPSDTGGQPAKIFKPICNKQFPYEMTVAFRLAADRKGFIDLSDPKSWKMEGAHQAIFKDGEQLSERHGEMLAAWARGAAPKQPAPPPAMNGGKPEPDHELIDAGYAASRDSMTALQTWWKSLSKDQRTAVGQDNLDKMKRAAEYADASGGAAA